MQPDSLKLRACRFTAILLFASIPGIPTPSGNEDILIAPPRTVDDITAILDQQKLSNPDAEQRAKERVLQIPSPGTIGLALAEFYHQRGIAAAEIGDFRRQLADLKRAAQLSTEIPDKVRSEILWDLGIAETFAGMSADGLRHREQAVALIRIKGRKMVRNALLGSHYALAGDLQTGDKIFAKANRTYKSARLWDSWKRYGDNWTRTVRWSEGRILYTKGLYRDAELKFREAHAAANAVLNSKGQARIPEQIRRNATIQIDIIQADIAKSLIGQQRPVEAEIAARAGLIGALSHYGRNSWNTAHLVRELASVIAAQNRFREAEQLARASIDIYLKIGVPVDSSMLAEARRELAGILVRQRSWDAALAEFEAIEIGLASDPTLFSRLFAGDLDWAIALVNTHKLDKAKSVAEKATEQLLNSVGIKHYNSAEAQGVLAIVYYKTGRLEPALKLFSEAIPILLSRSRGANTNYSSRATRDNRLIDILESYIGLLSEIQGTPLERAMGIDAANESFRIAEFARSRSVQEALAASSTRAAAGNEELAELIRREQDSRRQIAALFGLLADVLTLPEDQRDVSTVSSLRKRVDQLRIERGATAEEIERRFPSYANFINPKPVTIETVQDSLQSGEAMVVTYVAQEKTYIWAFNEKVEASFNVVDRNRTDILNIVSELRFALDPEVESLDEIPEFNITLAHQLYLDILVPVQAGWRGSDSLIIVAHGPLAQLPFSLLVTKDFDLPEEEGLLFANYQKVEWLARKHAVTVLPSVTSLVSLRALSKPAGARRSFVGFGDPYFNEDQAAEAEAEPEKPIQTVSLTNATAFEPHGLPIELRSSPKTRSASNAELENLPRLPDTRDEIHSIAIALGADISRDVFTGYRASERVVKSLDLSVYKVLAFSTHGLTPGDLNGLQQPALALSAPSLSGVDEKGDGLLTMDEILGLKLNADLVVLSACNTASAGVTGMEAFSGLGLAFFYAGARALLLSNWPVETTSAKALITDIFRRQSNDSSLTLAKAVQQAMLALIDGEGFINKSSGEYVFSYAHPIFWAPFSLVGDGEGNIHIP